jgi:hypothetical protein
MLRHPLFLRGMSAAARQRIADGEVEKECCGTKMDRRGDKEAWAEFQVRKAADGSAAKVKKAGA